MAEPAVICTIIAKNYVPFARTLCDSFLSEHPEGRCYVLIVDEFEGFIRPAEEKFEVLSLGQLGIPNIREWCFKYNVTELSTAVKPAFLRYLLREGSVRRVLYLDPDILVTGRLDALYETLRSSSVVLTPHLDTDIPDDGKMPDDAFILKSGVFNLGFIGVNDSPHAAGFLAWWESKLTEKCLVEPARGYMVDQRFVDLTVGLFDQMHSEKGAGYNAAYWNIHGRRISRGGEGRWECNGRPLYFYHFSGYKPERPEVISVHLTRFMMADRPDLQPLFTHYTQRLVANGYDEAVKWPYTFATFDTGDPILDRTRRYYLESPNRGKAFGDPFASPRLKAHSRSVRWLLWLRRVLYAPPKAARRIAMRLAGKTGT
jgi:hypothetical protein